MLNISKSSVAYLKNSSWMVLERLLRLLSSLFVGIYLARYLGPTDFGRLNYTVAFVAVFIPFVELGFSSILLREFVKNPEHKKHYAGTAFYMSLVSSVLMIGVINGLNLLVNESQNIRFLIFIYSLALLFKPFQIIDFQFQSELKSKKSSIIKSAGLLITSVLKIVFILSKAPLVYFIYVYALDIVLLSLFYVIVHFVTNEFNFYSYFKISLCYKMFFSIWPMIISNVAILLYMRTDQIMIQNMLNEKELGLYSAATRVYEGIIMITTVLTISLLPAIMKLKLDHKAKYHKYITLFLSFLFWSNCALALLITFFSEGIIGVLFGKEFLDSSFVLVIVSWSLGLTAFGSISSRYFTVENMEKKLVFRTIVSLSINILLNFILIPLYGINGSAFATLVSLLVGNYIIDYFDPELKTLVKLKNNALTLKFK